MKMLPRLAASTVFTLSAEGSGANRQSGRSESLKRDEIYAARTAFQIAGAA
jgi:hypothetical protein